MIAPAIGFDAHNFDPAPLRAIMRRRRPPNPDRIPWHSRIARVHLTDERKAFIQPFMRLAELSMDTIRVARPGGHRK